MNFHKKLLSLLLVAAMMVGIVQGARREIKIKTEEEETITAWYSRSDTMYFWYSEPELSDYISKAAVDFGEANNVHVFPMLITVDNYLEAVNTASIYNDQMPDAYVINHEMLEMVYLAGLATNISDAAGVCNQNNFSKSALNAVTYDGSVIGYPLYYDTCALVYNKDYLKNWAGEKALAILEEKPDSYIVQDFLAKVDDELEEANEDEWSEEGEPEIDSEYIVDPDLVPYKELSEEEKATVLAAKTEEIYETALPITLNELLTIADTFNAPDGAEGVMTWDISDIFYNYWIIGDVVELGGEAGDNKNKLFFNNKSTLNCLKYYQYLNEFFYIEADKVNYSDVIQNFIDGKMLFTIASVDSVETFRKAQNEGLMNFEYGYAMIPDVDDDIDSRNMSMTTAVVVNGYSEKKELANAFAAYLTSDYAHELYNMSGKPSCNINANYKYEELGIFDEEYAESIPLPKIIELENIWMELEALFSRIWGGDDIQTEIERIETMMNLLFPDN